MALNLGIQNMATNLNMPAEHIFLLVVVIGCIIFMAKDVRIGLVLMFLITGVSFMGIYALGLNFVPSLIVCLMSFVLMALSFYTGRNSLFARGGLV